MPLAGIHNAALLLPALEAVVKSVLDKAKIRAALVAVLAKITLSLSFSLAASDDALLEGFVSPPDTARPLVWWHWMNGNVSRAGIEADLKWLKASGIAGVQTTDAGLETPVVTRPAIPYLSPQWHEAFTYAADLAHSMDLSFGLFTSPGWSLTGGPWVKPEQAMKKLVWSKQRVKGGKRVKGTLPALPDVTGPFQSVPQRRSWLVAHDPEAVTPRHSAQAAVVAYRLPDTTPETARPTRVFSGSRAINGQALLDDDSSTYLDLPLPANGKPLQVDLVLDKPRTIRAVTVAAGEPATVINVAASLDGRKFRHVTPIFMWNTIHTTLAIKPVEARYFRFKIKPPSPKLPQWERTAIQGASTASLPDLFPLPEPSSVVRVRDLVLSEQPRVHHFESKAAFSVAADYYALDTPHAEDTLAISPERVLDITGHVSPEGEIDWDAPLGEWVVLRLGYSLLGKKNHAASIAGTGLEVDKLNADHVSDYLDDYLAAYYPGPGAFASEGQRLDNLMMDSLEIGTQNWTETILADFQRLRGYDPRPWLPTLTGVVVQSAEASDRFLWDFRKTLADLMLESHYRLTAKFARSKNLRLFGEALESARWSLGDDMDLRRYTDVPTAAMWTFFPENGPLPGYEIDVLGAASVANVYGQNLVAAESMTSALAPWAHSPRLLKPVVDRAFSLGMNLPIIHTSVHQPSMTERPGFSLSIFGQHFTRHDTWAQHADEWVDYLARTAYLLQQGRYVADVAYFYGEEAPLVSIFSQSTPTDVPPGTGFDFISADALLNQLSVKDGQLVTPSGMRYRLLYLGGTSHRMTVPVLDKIAELVAQGATVIGNPPRATPSLADDDAAFHERVTRLWDTDADNASPPIGKVWHDVSVAQAMEYLSIQPDFQFTTDGDPAEVVAIHRRTEDADIYFLSNRTAKSVSLDAQFRVTGRVPELWAPETGSAKSAPYRMTPNHTGIPLELAAYQSVFVVFRQSTDVRASEATGTEHTVLADISADWQITFPGEKPLVLHRASLTSWSDIDNNAVRYFSGTASYSREIEVPAQWLEQGRRIELDLGTIREIADVRINGEPAAVLWTEPYRTDITQLLTPGRNTVEVNVTNLWINRLIGDSRGAAHSGSFTAVPAYTPEAPLHPSGMLGPVNLVSSADSKAAR